LVVNAIWSASGVLGATSDFSASSLLASTNQQRLVDRENQLSLDPRLSQAAQAKADDMVASGYWSHTSPDGKTPWTFIAASGYNYERAGENLAYGFSGASQTIDGWMNSPEHRANILNAQYQNVGFGVANSAHYQGLWTRNGRCSDVRPAVRYLALPPILPSKSPRLKTPVPVTSSGPAKNQMPGW